MTVTLVSAASDLQRNEMNKKQAHFDALAYEPLRMKPAHFASGFFIALTDTVYSNELLNKVAVIKAGKGLLDDYAPEAVLDRLRDEGLIVQSMDQSNVELLRIQINSIVNNDDAMYPAFSPFRPKGNDYTFVSPRVLTKENRTDGYAGYFLTKVLQATDSGNNVLDFARTVANESQGTLERLVNPLLDDSAERSGLPEKYEREYGKLSTTRLSQIATQMHTQTAALQHLCQNLDDCSHYRRIRYLVIGLLAWLTSYLLKTASVNSANPILLFDFVGEREGPIRSQSRTCYARVRESVRLAYRALANADKFSFDPFAEKLFVPRNRDDGNDFRFLEEHFGDLVLRIGYAQPRASSVAQKHFETQPDTLRVLMLSILDHDAASAITFDEVCTKLRNTWNFVIGGSTVDSRTLHEQGYFGFDEADLQRNAGAFAERLKSLNLAVEPSDGLILCSRDLGEVL